jgi:glycerate kinase
VRALACPASLKGVLSPIDAAAALARGIRRRPGWVADELPVADGGEGTAEVLARTLGGHWSTVRVHDPLGRGITARFLLLEDGTAVVESAEAVGLGLLTREELDPLTASSAGLGELLLGALAAAPRAVLATLGGTATVDGGVGLLSVIDAWPERVPLRVACDVRNPLLGPRGAARAFGPQKGAAPADVDELERRLGAIERLRRFRALPGAGAGGGLGAALAALGGVLCEGAALVLDTVGFDARAAGAVFAVTGEGTVDRTTLEGKAPGEVVRRCGRLGVRCVLFGGRVESVGLEARALSGDPRRAADDLAALGEELAAGVSQATRS